MTAQVTPSFDDSLEWSKSVLGKTQLLLDAYTEDDTDLSLSELVRRTGLAKASVYRLMQGLLTWGVIERSGPNYRLGLRLFEMGQRVPRQRILRDAALPFMQDLLLATRETIHFAIQDGLEVLYIEKIMLRQGVRQESRVAGRLPLHSTATGKIFLAYSHPSLREEIIQRGLPALTHRTLTAPKLLLGQLEVIRQRGLATESEETRLGYASLAAPVFSEETGLLVGALSITTPTTRMHVNRLATGLRSAAAAIGGSL